MQMSENEKFVPTIVAFCCNWCSYAGADLSGTNRLQYPANDNYTSGNFYARRRMTLLFSMLDYLGIERNRTRVEWVSAAEGAKFAATMNSFAEEITKLGPNRRLEDLRCKK